MTRTNVLGQPIGPELPEWRKRSLPESVILAGQYVRLEPVDAGHADGIRQELAPYPGLWTYRSDEPPGDQAEAAALVERLQVGPNVALAVIRLADDSFQGMVTIMRADPVDTTWFSITDREWPRVRAAHRRWLDPANFDADGHQRLALGGLLAK